MMQYRYVWKQMLLRGVALAVGWMVIIGAVAQTTLEVELGTGSVFVTEPCPSCTCIWYVDGVVQSSDGPRFEIEWAETGTHYVSVQFEWENCYSPMTDYPVLVVETPKDPLDPSPFFTPNGDGGNDVWEIRNIELWPDADIRIYDRFHKLLVRYRGDENGWDGTFRGHKCVSDDYWYLISYDNGRQQLSGHLTLKR